MSICSLLADVDEGRVNVKSTCPLPICCFKAAFARCSTLSLDSCIHELSWNDSAAEFSCKLNETGTQYGEKSCTSAHRMFLKCSIYCRSYLTIRWRWAMCFYGMILVFGVRFHTLAFGLTKAQPGPFIFVVSGCLLFHISSAICGAWNKWYREVGRA